MKTTLIALFVFHHSNAQNIAKMIRPQLPPGWWENKLQKTILSGYGISQ